MAQDLEPAVLKRHDGRGVATRGLTGVDGNIDPLQDATLDGGKACRRGAPCVLALVQASGLPQARMSACTTGEADARRATVSSAARIKVGTQGLP